MNFIWLECRHIQSRTQQYKTDNVSHTKKIEWDVCAEKNITVGSTLHISNHMWCNESTWSKVFMCVCDFLCVCMLNRYVEREIDIYCYAQHLHEKDMQFEHMSVYIYKVSSNKKNCLRLSSFFLDLLILRLLLIINKSI